MDDKTMFAFTAISSFIEDLCAYQDEYLPLKLYLRLVRLTKPENSGPIQKHVEAFRSFCTANANAILSQDITKINREHNLIKYSTNVYLDVPALFAIIRDDDQRTFWVHLITIYGIIEQNTQAKEVLKSMKPTASAPVMPALPDLTELMSDMQRGQINGNKLMGMLHTMIDGLASTADESSRVQFEKLRGMIPKLDEHGNPIGAPPNPADLMGVLMNLKPDLTKGE